MTDPDKAAKMTVPTGPSGARTFTLSSDDQDIVADALGHLYQTAPRRRTELLTLAERTGLGLCVDGGDDD